MKQTLDKLSKEYAEKCREYMELAVRDPNDEDSWKWYEFYLIQHSRTIRLMLKFKNEGEN